MYDVLFRNFEENLKAYLVIDTVKIPFLSIHDRLKLKLGKN